MQCGAFANTRLGMFRSILWWSISVVVVGIATNLISAYLKPIVDVPLGKMFGWWRRRSEAQRARFEEEVNRVRNDVRRFILMTVDELRYWCYQAIAVLASALMMLYSLSSIGDSDSTVFFVGIAITVVIVGVSVSLQGTALRLRSILHKAVEGPPAPESKRIDSAVATSQDPR